MVTDVRLMHRLLYAGPARRSRDPNDATISVVAVIAVTNVFTMMFPPRFLNQAVACTPARQQPRALR